MNTCFWARLVPVLLLLALARALPQTPAAHPPSPAPQVRASPLTAGFPGAWVGQLEHRDSQTDAQTFFPAWLTMTSPDATSVTFAYVYDDGPGKIVREEATLAFNTTMGTATLRSGNATDLLEVHGLSAFARAGSGTLTFTGTGTVDGKPAYVRILLTLDRNLYMWRRETRAQDGTGIFRFHDAYIFTRELPLSP